MIGSLDHVALGVKDLEERIAFFTTHLGMHVKRRGTHFKTGKGIVLLGDAKGFKLELIEADVGEPTFMHVAFRVDDVAGAHDDLLAAGCSSIRGPHALKASLSETALVQDGAKLQIQVIKYDPASPDL